MVEYLSQGFLYAVDDVTHIWQSLRLGGRHPLAATWQGHTLVVAVIRGLSTREGGNITVGDHATLRFELICLLQKFIYDQSPILLYL